jgi:hypothetical protein
MRLRIGITGKLFGFVNIRWTLLAKNLNPVEHPYAFWLKESFDGQLVNAGPVKGVCLVELAEV